MALYRVLLFVHITAIAIWVGGGFMFALLGARAARQARLRLRWWSGTSR